MTAPYKYRFFPPYVKYFTSEDHIEGDLMFKSKEDQLLFNKSIDTSGWVRDSAGIHTAGWGLTLSPMDMAKIGQLYLNKGLWGGKQIVSEKWVEESTREHSPAALFVPKARDRIDLIKTYIEPI